MLPLTLQFFIIMIACAINERQQKALDGGRIGIASLALGLALAAHEFAVVYSVDRKQFGRSISKFQAIQWMIADSATELEAARALVLRAAHLKEKGRPFTREASIAKLYTSEKAFVVCDRALQILGDGYSREYPVERTFGMPGSHAATRAPARSSGSSSAGISSLAT
jgi:alkylation response protein AidB-like acyl-CoA dehydrogenase